MRRQWPGRARALTELIEAFMNDRNFPIVGLRLALCLRAPPPQGYMSWSDEVAFHTYVWLFVLLLLLINQSRD